MQLESNNIDLRADLAWAMWHGGRTAEAIQEYAAVTARDPEWPEKTRAAGWRWATDADPGRRSGFEAVRRAEQAWQAQGQCDAQFADTLATAYAVAGRFEEAVALARWALELACNDPGLRAEVEERLRGYLSRRPYHQ